ncbi:MAG: hypothetical protein U5K69_03595 [Balneolaceae bacterium]|nr:hypothetical protein [Balneolaceae bacterium]
MNATRTSCPNTCGAMAMRKGCGSGQLKRYRIPLGPQLNWVSKVVNGFTGSSIWSKLYSFPPNKPDTVEKGFQDFADRWNPILDVFDEEGIRFGSGGASHGNCLRYCLQPNGL